MTRRKSTWLLAALLVAACGRSGPNVNVHVCTTACTTRADCPSSELYCADGYCEHGGSCL